MKERFIKSAIKERYLFLLFQNINHIPIQADEYTPVDGYEPYDIIFSSGTTINKKPLEIKVRNYSLNDYAEEGWVIEYQKLKALKAVDNECYYCCFFKDGIIFWDLTNITEEQIEYNHYNKYTVNKSAGTKLKANIKLKNKNALTIYHCPIPDISHLVDRHYKKKFSTFFN